MRGVCKVKILHIGDIVGSTGRQIFAQVATRWKADNRADAVVVNAENAAGGRGLTAALGDDLLAAGADVITLGDHTWDQKDTGAYLDRESRVIRPANFAPDCPGGGVTRVETEHGRLTVISLIGRVFMPPAECPFRMVDRLLKEQEGGGIVLVEIHAEATSEKIAMGRHLDGRVTSVAGTHTHVATADETILPRGTAYITDLGMTGPHDSVLGREVAPVLHRFVTGMPAKFDVATNDVALNGILLDVDPRNGRARGIKRIRETL